VLQPRVLLVYAEWQLALSMVGAQVLVLLIGLIILRARDRLVAEIRERSRISPMRWSAQARHAPRPRPPAPRRWPRAGPRSSSLPTSPTRSARRWPA
jgi:hypothetical protein